MPPPYITQPIHSSLMPRILATSEQTPVASSCLYAGKPCQSARAVKLSGGLHRYCDMHRMRHNSFQRAYQMRRQLRRDQRKDAVDNNNFASGQLQASPETWAIPQGPSIIPRRVELSSRALTWPIPANVDVFSSSVLLNHDDVLDVDGATDNPTVDDIIEMFEA